MMRRNTKFVLGGAAGLVVLVACTVAVTLAVTLSDRQQFVDEPKTSGDIIEQIRQLMRDPDVVGSPIQAYIITSVDAHQSEYIAPSDQRILYVSSFSGSAGTVIITVDKALLWTDSRYHIQAEAQLDPEYWTLMKAGNPGVPSYQEWLTQNLVPDSVIGIDPLLIDSTTFQSISTYLSAARLSLKSITQNLVDIIWEKGPPLISEIVVLPLQYSGRIISDKLVNVRKEMLTLGVQSHIVTALDDIAWLLNLRGLDIPYNPVFFSYVIITENEVRLYIKDERRITPTILSHFEDEGVKDEIKVFEYDKAVAGLAEIVENTTGKILLSRTSQAFYDTVPEARRVTKTSPIVLLKVVKNTVEANGMREANIRDGAAVIQYLSWLNRTIGLERVTELSGAAKLGEFRAGQGDHFRGLSFEAISAVGSNAAMAHYSPTEETDTQIVREEMYLIDSGGQYWDGTTDTTRTVHFGNPTDFQMEAFTRVLKGFISMGSSTFPVKAPFSFFDAMARRALWDVGLNYGHGTGHGIGAYLNVHEYPPSVSSANTDPGMLENMFTSNEPGFYQEGEFGIRIEDVVQAVPAYPKHGNFNNVGALQFYHITMVPIQTSLIKVDLMTKQEIDWLNEYHERVYTNTVPVLERLGDNEAREWLFEQTRPINYVL